MKSEITLSMPVPQKLQDDLLKNLYWVDSRIEKVFLHPSDPQSLRFECKTAGRALKNVASRLKIAANRLLNSMTAVESKIFYKNKGRRSSRATATYEELCEKGWVIPVGYGNHAYFGLMQVLYQALDWKFRQAAMGLGAEDVKLPALLDLDTLAKSGYLENFPQNLNLVSHGPRPNRKNSPLQKTDFPLRALSPTVCYPFFQSQQGRILKSGTSGITAHSACYRFEGKATQGLRRLGEFNMREIVFIGPPKAIAHKLKDLLACQKNMLEYCQLESLIQTASDPFFMGNNDRKRLYQLSFDLKYEVTARIPTDPTWLAIGSVNNHEDHLTKAFNIKLSSGEHARSCCLGFGIDRWCMAIFSQHGLALKNWPISLQKLIAKFRERAA